MITNEWQYKATRTELKKFYEAVEAAREAGPGPDVHPRIHQAMVDAFRSDIDNLENELRHYDDLKQGRITRRKLHSIRDLAIALIEARIAAGMTQHDLAQRLNLKDQQIQRYEKTLYSGASLDRLQQVADALDLHITEDVVYPVPA